jgi:nitrous oxide reductase accessory protein NosL
MIRFWLVVILIVFLGMADGAFSQPPEIETNKKCPLCSMYPARYPKFNCQIVFKDGGYEAFDSAIGLLVYLHFPDKTGKALKPVAGIYFKDYLKNGWLEAEKAYFVTGSDIRGPMGIQFLPVDSQPAAEQIKKQANGKDVIHFKMIDRQYLINAAKNGQLHKMAKKLVLK